MNNVFEMIVKYVKQLKIKYLQKNETNNFNSRLT